MCSAKKQPEKKMTKCRGDFFLKSMTPITICPATVFLRFAISHNNSLFLLIWVNFSYALMVLLYLVQYKKRVPSSLHFFFFSCFYLSLVFLRWNPRSRYLFFLMVLYFFSNGSIDFAMLRIACRQKTRGHGQTHTQKTKNASGESQWFYWMGKLR